MKSLLYLVPAVVLCFAACENVNTPAVDGSGSPEDLPVKGVVTDGDGELIGYAVSVSVLYLQMFTPESYLVTVTWDGRVLQSVSMYFSETDFGGEPFALYPGSYSPYGRSAWQVDGTFWTYADTSAGYAQPLEESYTSYESMILNENTRYESYSRTISGNLSFALTTVSREAVGLPEDIVPPLNLEWE